MLTMLLLRVVSLLLISAGSHVVAEPLHPIIFTGGVGASMMMADLDKTTQTHWYCSEKAKDYPLWLYFRNLVPGKADCWIDNLSLRWNQGQMQDFGVKIKLVGDHLLPGQDINTGFAKPIWHDLLTGVADLGYSGTSPHVSALHYDWRLSLAQLEADGTFAKFKASIEAAVTKAGGKKAILVTLSYGGALMHKFLSTFVDAAWKQANIERWISLSGVFGGTAELTRMALYPEPKDFFNIPKILPYISLDISRTMSNTFPSSFVLQPHFLGDGETLINASINGVYNTYTKYDFSRALADSGLLQAQQVYEFAKDAYSFHALPAPGVAVDCVYGVGDPTISSITFGDGFNHSATGYHHEDGDGVAPTRSLSLCGQWKVASTPPVARKLSTSTQSEHVTIHTFPKIGHGGTLHDPVAVQAFGSIVRSVNGVAVSSPCAPVSTSPNPCAPVVPAPTPAPITPAPTTQAASPCLPVSTSVPNPCAIGTVKKFEDARSLEDRPWGEAIGPLGPGFVQMALGIALFALLVVLAVVAIRRKRPSDELNSYVHMRGGSTAEIVEFELE